tara:strand:- start:51 stop:761 length:711 start_codon:yes stop_codon:yes gene_type:complete
MSNSSHKFSFNDNFPDPKGEAIISKKKEYKHPFKQQFNKRTKKKILDEEIIRFQKKMITDFLAILKRKEFTTRQQKDIFKILKKDILTLSNNIIYTKKNLKRFLEIYHRINVVYLKDKFFSKKKRLSKKFEKDKMKKHIEECRKVFRICCCALESDNEFLSPNDKPDYGIIDIDKLLNLALYSLLLPKEMLNILDRVDELKCLNLGDDAKRIKQSLYFLFTNSITNSLSNQIEIIN